jgi:hypothetical protein
MPPNLRLREPLTSPGWEPSWWRNGGRGDLWLKNIERIGRLIKEWKLEPVAAEHFIAEKYSAPLSSVKEEKERLPFRWPRSFWGGIRIPHLHFKGDLFLPNEKQWREFTAEVMKDFQAKLAKASAISFDQMMEISEAVDSLP